MSSNKLADLYWNAGCSGSMLRENAKRPVFVELFAGTGSMSKEARGLSVRFADIITLDIDDKFHTPTYKCDILEVKQDHDLYKKLYEYIEAGHMIICHASPPCNEFSRMSGKRECDRDFAGAMKMVTQAYNIMQEFSNIYTIENPSTGYLWKQDFAQEHFTHFKDVSYCMYGWTMKKQTRIVLSTKELYDEFQAKTCGLKNGEPCGSCVKSHETGRWVHRSMENVPDKSERIAIPPQLCRNLISVMYEESSKLAFKIASVLDDKEYGNKTIPKSNKRNRNDVNYREVSDSEDDEDEDITIEGKIIRKGDVVFYRRKARDVFMLASDANIYKKGDRNWTLHAVCVDKVRGMSNGDERLFVIFGRLFLGDIYEMKLNEHREYEIVPDDSIVCVQTCQGNLFSDEQVSGVIQDLKDMDNRLTPSKKTRKNQKKLRREAREYFNYHKKGRLTQEQQKKVDNYCSEMNCKMSSGSSNTDV